MTEITTANGKTYTLRMKDGDFFYRWYGDGKLPKQLSGGFTGIDVAVKAANLYLRTVDDVKVLKSAKARETLLDSLSKKKDLLEFASKEGIEIPETMKMPLQIRKYLLTQIGE